MPPTRTINILQPTHHNPPRASGNPYASLPPRLSTPQLQPEEYEAQEVEVAETLTSYLPIINYDHLLQPQAATHKEGTMSDRISWAIIHPDLQDQVHQWLVHITHSQVFVETYQDLAILGQFITQFREHSMKALAPSGEKERMAIVGMEAHAVCFTAAQRVMNFLNNGRTIAALKDLLPQQPQHTDHLVQITAKPDLRVSRLPILRHEGCSLTLLPTLKEDFTIPRVSSLETPATFVQRSSGGVLPWLSALLERAKQHALINEGIHDTIS